MSAIPESIESVRVAVLGAGMSGICMGIQLRKQGIDDFVILEKADSVGGTWRENTYPGVACDVPSHVYSFSFELNPELEPLVFERARNLGLLRTLRRQVSSCATRSAFARA